MTKVEVIKEVSKRIGLPIYAVKLIIDETIEIMKESVCSGEPIYLRGLFTLSAVKRGTKHARNICKGEAIISPPHYAPKATFSKELQDKVRQIPVK